MTWVRTQFWRKPGLQRHDGKVVAGADNRSLLTGDFGNNLAKGLPP